MVTYLPHLATVLIMEVTWTNTEIRNVIYMVHCIVGGSKVGGRLFGFVCMCVYLPNYSPNGSDSLQDLNMCSLYA